MAFFATESMAFQFRLQGAVKKAGGNNVIAKRSGVPLATLNSYMGGKSEPTISRLFHIAKACDVSIDWLSGLTLENASGDVAIHIPRYDVQLSAGDGHWNEDELTPLDYIPFTKEFLQKKLGRKSTNDLLILEASGDSMQPTIVEGDLVLVDQRLKSKTDGVYAFIQDGLARVKRFKFLTSGKVQIVSDNRELYTPETLSNEEAEYLHIIGRVRWIGHTV